MSNSGPADFTRIQEALDAAPPRALVRVAAGTYPENLVLRKPVELVADGAAGTVFVESDAAVCLSVRRRGHVSSGSAWCRKASAHTKGTTRSKSWAADAILENCDVTSSSGACVAVHGEAAAPLLRGCRIHDGRDVGHPLSSTGPAGTIEDCEIVGHTNDGICVQNGASPTVRKSTNPGRKDRRRLHRGRQWNFRGLRSLRQRAQRRDGGERWRPALPADPHPRRGLCRHRLRRGGEGTFDGCDVTGCASSRDPRAGGGDPTVRACRIADGKAAGILWTGKAGAPSRTATSAATRDHGILVRNGASPVVRNCQVHGGGDIGLTCSAEGAGTFDECVFSGALNIGILVKDGGNPTVRQSQFRGLPSGIVCDAGSRGSFEKCDVIGSSGSGIELKNGGASEFFGCRVGEGKAAGILCDASRGTFEDCEVFGNVEAGLIIQAGGSPSVRKCRFHSGKGPGILATGNGAGTLEECEIFGNADAGISLSRGTAIFRSCGPRSAMVWESGLRSSPGRALSRTATSRATLAPASTCRTAPSRPFRRAPSTTECHSGWRS